MLLDLESRDRQRSTQRELQQTLHAQNNETQPQSSGGKKKNSNNKKRR